MSDFCQYFNSEGNGRFRRTGERRWILDIYYIWVRVDSFTIKQFKDGIQGVENYAEIKNFNICFSDLSNFKNFFI